MFLLPPLLDKLSSLVSNWRLILCGLVAALFLFGVLYIKHLRSDLLEMSIELSQQQEVNAENLRTLEKIRKEQARNMEALERERRQQALRTRQLEDLLKESRNEKDGPVAPVLRHTLDALRLRFPAGPVAD